MLWKTSDLPLELSTGPFTAAFVGEKQDHPVVFFPGWIILDANGVAVASVARGIDATYLAELLNRVL